MVRSAAAVDFLEAYQGLDMKDKETVQIVMLTTSSNPVDTHKVKEFGVSDFLNKPLTEEGLKELLNKYSKS